MTSTEPPLADLAPLAIGLVVFCLALLLALLVDSLFVPKAKKLPLARGIGPELPPELVQRDSREPWPDSPEDWEQ